MIQNLIWATGYNLIAIPLVAGILYSSGFVLGPAVGDVFMSLSTVIVAIDAQLLKGKLKKKHDKSKYLVSIFFNDTEVLPSFYLDYFTH